MINVYRTHEGSTRLGIIVAGRILDCEHRPLERVTYVRQPTDAERDAFEEIWQESVVRHFHGLYAYGVELYRAARPPVSWIETLSPVDEQWLRWPIEILRMRLAECLDA